MQTFLEGRLSSEGGKRMVRIIVISDEKGGCALLRSHLESVGHNVTEASDGLVALAAFDQESYELIIVDALLPEEDGIMVARLSPKLQPEAKVLAITGGGPNPSSVWAQEIRIEEYHNDTFRISLPLGWCRSGTQGLERSCEVNILSLSRIDGPDRQPDRCIDPESARAAAVGRPLVFRESR